MNATEIRDALKPAFNDIDAWDTGGNIVCCALQIGDNGAHALITDEGDGFMVGFYDADNEENGGVIVLSQGTIEQVAAMLFALRARFFIHADWEPADLKSINNFADLHNICDANAYLELAFKYAIAAGWVEPWAFLNEVIEGIEALETFSK